MSMPSFNQSSTVNVSVVQSAGALRRIGAVVYDTLLVVGLVGGFTFLFTRILDAEVTRSSGLVFYVFRVMLLLLILGFFVFFWVRKGRTLGMQAWRLRIERLDGSLPTVRDALMRLLLALVPWLPALIAIVVGVQLKFPLVTRIGYWLFVLVLVNYVSARFDAYGRSWHDRFLQTRIRPVKN